MRKRLLKSLRLSRGFTMIELLVVIAIIGVLAVAVLSSINPIEQINKGRDTRVRSDVAQLLTGVERYYTVQEEYPWNRNFDSATTTDANDIDYAATVTDPADEFVLNPDNTPVPGEADWAWVWQLAATSEVKGQFASRVTTDAPENYLFGKGDTATDTVYVCFKPTSLQFQQEAMRKCCPEGSTTGSCLANDAIAGTAPDDVGGVDPCGEAEGTVGPDNYICLP